jgi:hypothetical protein
MFEFFGGRKNFYVLIVTVLVSTVFTVSFFLTPIDKELSFSVSSWLEFLKWSLTGYLAANALIAIPEKLSGKHDEAQKFFSVFGGRKNFYALFVTVMVTTVFLISFFGPWGRFSTDEWLGFLKWAVVSYLGANTLNAIPAAIPDNLKKNKQK